MSMLSKMYNRTMTVKRNAVSSTDDAGEEQLTQNTIYTDIPCYMEPDSGKYFMAGPGLTDINYQIVICDLNDTSGNQYVFNKGDIAIIDSVSYKLDDADDFEKPGIPHWELHLTGGVL